MGPPPPPLAFSLLSVLPRLSALVFFCVRLLAPREPSNPDPPPLDKNPLSPLSVNLSPLNATEGWSAMLPPARCPLMSLTMSSWPPSRELQSSADITSQSFDFLVAAEAGRQFQSVEKCELRYTCPLSSTQLREIFREL